MSKHMKRLTIPRSWSLPRKVVPWAVKPRPGPHPVERSIPLLVAIRDYLKYADTAKEAKFILGSREIMVDGKIVTDHKRPVGFMDVIAIPKTDEYFRVLLDSRGRLRLVRIEKERSEWKLVRIENKTTVRGGRTQLNLHDGRNILLEKDQYRTGDVLKIALPTQKIMDHYPFQEGRVAMIIGGKHAGQVATIKSYEVTRSPKPNIVHFDEFSTIKDYVFVVGRTTPEITVPEVSVI
jgi:small subunit ribosomal protein S4e